jgi:hypothetical protein
MKRGGEEIYAGPLGHHSSELIKYYEVKWYYKNLTPSQFSEYTDKPMVLYYSGDSWSQQN